MNSMHQLEPWAMIPFVLMLLSIAVMPLAAGKWWQSNLHKLYVSFALAIAAGIYLEMNGLGENLLHQMLYDYLPFIILLASLFIVTGGIRIEGNVAPTPAANVSILCSGFVLASFMGTTGAAMLLIRRLIEINRQRKYKTHTILFFIALVANCGGILTPLGDPPLFLLYLRGADFFWFMNLAPQWLFTGGLLILIYYFTDRHYFGKESAEVRGIRSDNGAKIRITGKRNILALIAIVLTVSLVNHSYITAMADPEAPFYIRFLREILLVVIAVVSLAITRSTIRRANSFSWEPIVEVAVLFIGIFATMTPALIYLNANAAALGLTHPWQFYYGTGALSQFLDNAPTALAFHTVATGLPHVDGVEYVADVPEMLLAAISLGAVFFGAMTYIGNGPNFMVKSIAEQNGIRMPSFFGYMFKFSIIILLPVYILMQLIFL